MTGKLLALAAFCVVLSSPAQASAGLETGVEAPAKVAGKLRSSEAEALALVKAYSPSALRRQVELHTLQTSFDGAMRKDSTLAAMLDAFPELSTELLAALSANLDVYLTEYDERFFPAAATIVRDYVTRDDVRELTTFYNSAFGQKLLRIGATNVDAGEVAGKGLKGDVIDAAVVKRQTVRAGFAVLGKLEVAERQRLVSFSQAPLFQRFKRALPKIKALQADLTSNPSPRFTAANERDFNAVMKRVTGLDPAVH